MDKINESRNFRSLIVILITLKQATKIFIAKTNAQYAEWDLKKTSSTLTETLIGLFVMA